jgi:uncharacterized protein YecA (UPF0149 family)
MNVEDVRNAVRVQGFGRIYFAEETRSRSALPAFVRIGRCGPIRRAGAKIGRNGPCPCGSGLKFKRCCAQSKREAPIPNP